MDGFTWMALTVLPGPHRRYFRKVLTAAISHHTLLVPTGAVHGAGPVHALKLGVGAGRGVQTLVDVCNMHTSTSTVDSAVRQG